MPKRCPRCGFDDAPADACPRCGVIFAKLHAAAAASARTARQRTPAAPGQAPARPLARTRGASLGVLALAAGAAVAVAALGAAALWYTGALSPPPPTSTEHPAPSPFATVTAAPPAAGLSAESTPTPRSRLDAWAPAPASTTTKASAPLAVRADRERALGLLERLRAGTSGPSERAEAERLFAAYPGEPAVRELLVATLLAAAQQELVGRRFASAESSLARAAELAPGDPRPRTALAETRLAAGNWPAAEATAREALRLAPDDARALRTLGYALFRQDRNREALEVLAAALAREEHPEARAAYERLLKSADDERGMTERRLARFNVRYDGEEHDAVGREILRALERHYATLTVALDHEPKAPIPVILFSREAYFDAAGAPAWSGGAYEPLDGRIRVPIGGLTTALSAEVDKTLLHEVTHAFIADKTRGVAPRDLHEGLAQFMEGERIADKLDHEGLRALADGRIGGAPGFYLAALAFVEDLEAQRGRGGINDLLSAMGETGSVDLAFERVYGRDHEATRAAWAARMRQRYGS